MRPLAFLRVLVVVTGMFIVAISAIEVWAQAQTWLKSMPEQGYNPSTIIIEKDAPARNLVCVVPDRGGPYACITVGELRVVVFNRKMLK
jgi:hypothetical protein